MDDALYYLAINRQSGLRSELGTIANNVANIDTTGFRKQGVIFQEFVDAAGSGQSLSMADLNLRYASALQGEVTVTGNALDLAVEGDGYFTIDDGEGVLLTRAGHFQRSETGLMVTPNGNPVLDTGGAPIFLPPDAGPITIAPDGTISADGQPIAQIAVVTARAEGLTRVGDTAFAAKDDPEPVAVPKLRQGALERSNVNPVEEIARMIEVSRAYEQVQGLIEDEDQRIRDSITTLGQAV